MAMLPLTIDEEVQYHSEITSAGALRAVATAALQIPVVWTVMISGDPDANENWKLRKRGMGETDNGISFIVPTDYDASTNAVIWTRIS